MPRPSALRYQIPEEDPMRYPVRRSPLRYQINQNLTRYQIPQDETRYVVPGQTPSRYQINQDSMRYPINQDETRYQMPEESPLRYQIPEENPTRYPMPSQESMPPSRGPSAFKNEMSPQDAMAAPGAEIAPPPVAPLSGNEAARQRFHESTAKEEKNRGLIADYEYDMRALPSKIGALQDDLQIMVDEYNRNRVNPHFIRTQNNQESLVYQIQEKMRERNKMKQEYGEFTASRNHLEELRAAVAKEDEAARAPEALRQAREHDLKIAETKRPKATLTKGQQAKLDIDKKLIQDINKELLDPSSLLAPEQRKTLEDQRAKLEAGFSQYTAAQSTGTKPSQVANINRMVTTDEGVKTNIQALRDTAITGTGPELKPEEKKSVVGPVIVDIIKRMNQGYNVDKDIAKFNEDMPQHARQLQSAISLQEGKTPSINTTKNKNDLVSKGGMTPKDADTLLKRMDDAVKEKGITSPHDARIMISGSKVAIKWTAEKISKIARLLWDTLNEEMAKRPFI